MTQTKHIEMRGVRKTFRFFTLDDLSLDLEPGQIMGFVGAERRRQEHHDPPGAWA